MSRFGKLEAVLVFGAAVLCIMLRALFDLSDYEYFLVNLALIASWTLYILLKEPLC